SPSRSRPQRRCRSVTSSALKSDHSEKPMLVGRITSEGRGASRGAGQANGVVGGGRTPNRSLSAGLEGGERFAVVAVPPAIGLENFAPAPSCAVDIAEAGVEMTHSRK